MKRLRLLPEARVEYFAAIDWYEERRHGLGAKFFEQVRRSFDQIRETPQRYPAVYLDVRKLRLKGLPYVVLYQSFEDEILVISVFHTSRNPDEWKSRLS